MLSTVASMQLKGIWYLFLDSIVVCCFGCNFFGLVFVLLLLVFKKHHAFSLGNYFCCVRAVQVSQFRLDWPVNTQNSLEERCFVHITHAFFPLSDPSLFSFWQKKLKILGRWLRFEEIKTQTRHGSSGSISAPHLIGSPTAGMGKALLSSSNFMPFPE